MTISLTIGDTLGPAYYELGYYDHLAITSNNLSQETNASD